MSIIKQINRLNDGNIWQTYQIGTDALNTSIDTTAFNNIPKTITNTQEAFNQIDDILGNKATTAETNTIRNYINNLYSLTAAGSATTNLTTIKGSEVKLTTNASVSIGKLGTTASLDDIGKKLNYLLTTRGAVTNNNRWGINLIYNDSTGMKYNMNAGQRETVSCSYTPPAGYNVIMAFHPTFTGTNAHWMNCSDYYYDYSDKQLIATIRNVNNGSANWTGGSIYWRVLLVYNGG